MSSLVIIIMFIIFTIAEFFDPLTLIHYEEDEGGLQSDDDCVHFDV